ncbi:hypothetical protein HanRHA438_Chr12g0565911 [Helianthus annuus]|nr:hypothetical protein HanRHA438_Chr12g0565911 [Helianthus annuus]
MRSASASARTLAARTCASFNAVAPRVFASFAAASAAAFYLTKSAFAALRLLSSWRTQKSFSFSLPQASFQSLRSSESNLARVRTFSRPADAAHLSVCFNFSKAAFSLSNCSAPSRAAFTIASASARSRMVSSSLQANTL